MKRDGRPRRELITRLTPRDGLIIDVGADHGHIAKAVGAIATERMPHRSGRSDLRWVIADGLAPFRHVNTCIIAGMGADTIAGILDRGPRPQRAVLHAPDSPPRLRLWLASNGYRIVKEGLTPEAKRFAEVVVVEEGQETARGLWLELGPKVLTDPTLDGRSHLPAHLEQLAGWYQGIADGTRGKAPDKHVWATERAAFCRERRAELAV